MITQTPTTRTTQTYYQFGNLFVNKTVIEFKTGEPWKQVEVTRFDGQYHEILVPNDPDYKKAHILSLNLDNA